jgi:predicted thioesterase
MIVSNSLKQPVKLILTWNGIDTPFQWIDFDAVPEFDFVLFNYAGNLAIPENSNQYHFSELLTIATEFKGSILNEVYHHYKTQEGIDYIGFMDDDIQISVSAINQLLSIAYQNNLDAFQAAVDASSFHSFQFNEQQEQKGVQYVNWVEIMSPFYRKSVFDAAHTFYASNISSYGIDNFAIPFYQQILGLTRTAVIHQVSMKHMRPVTDGSKVFSNGLTARQEGELVRKKILKMIKEDASIKLNATFLKEVLEVNTFRWKVWKNLLKDYIKKRIL